MAAMLSEALRLQDTARELLQDADRGNMDRDAFEDRTVKWTYARRDFATLTPQNPVDALTQLHSISQAATALLTSKDTPEAVEGLAVELILGLTSQIRYLEQIVGRTCEELALFHEYSPPTGIH